MFNYKPLKVLFRCSSLGHIMTNSKNKSRELSETAKAHCVDVYVRTKYGRSADISNKFIEKGLKVEERSITLLSRVMREFYKKNEENLKNEYISGTPDLYVGESISGAEVVIDVKSSWDLFTFHRTRVKDLNKIYYWQLQGYMALTGADSAMLAYCLVDTPQEMIIEEQRRLFYRMGVVSEQNADYVEACKQLETSMTYDDIPLDERLHIIEIERNNADISAIYDRVQQCREFIAQLDHNVENPKYLKAI